MRRYLWVIKLRRILRTVVLLALIVTILLTTSCTFGEYLLYGDISETSEIANYNTEEYPISYSFFPRTIPEYVTVADFYYFDCKKDLEYFLDLRFATVDDLKELLEVLLEQSHHRAYEVWQVPNPFQEGYTDVVLERFLVNQADDSVYSYLKYSDDLSCFHGGYFNVITYSESDLRMLITAIMPNDYYYENKVNTLYYFSALGIDLKSFGANGEYKVDYTHLRQE